MYYISSCSFVSVLILWFLHKIGDYEMFSPKVGVCTIDLLDEHLD